MSDAQNVARLREIRDNAKAITAMPAFQYWKEQVLAQSHGRAVEIRKPLSSHDAILEQEFTKGEMNGLEQGVLQWDLIIELLTEEIKDLEAQNAEDQPNPAIP